MDFAARFARLSYLSQDVVAILGLDASCPFIQMA